MSDKKNIDRLFQEKFKDFEASPPEFVWENIREVLEDKKKKRVIPLWFRLGGVAAVIVIGLLLGNFYLNGWNGANQDPAVTTAPGATQGQQPLKVLPTDVDAHNNNTKGTNNTESVNSAVVVNGDGKGKAATNNGGATGAEPGSHQKVLQPSSTGANNAVVHSPKNTYNTEKGKKGVKQNSLLPPDNNAVVNTTTKNNKGVTQPDNAAANNALVNNSKGNRGNNTNTSASPNTGIAGNGSFVISKDNTNVKGSNAITNRNMQPANAVANNGNSASKNNSNKNGAVTTGVNGVADTGPQNGGNKANKSNSLTGSAVANTTTSSAGKNTGNTGKAQGGNVVPNGSNDTSANALAVQENKSADVKAPVIDTTTPITDKAIAETAIDTAAVAPENALEKLLREQQEGKKDEKDKAVADNSNKSKWNVKPQVAPVFYNSLSNGSPIDDQFASNAKSYGNDLSMGVGVNYAVTSKISIRSGVNTVNLNYATKGVEFYASLNNQTNNVAAKSANANIVVQDQGTTNNLEVFFADRLPTDTFNGSMIQKTGYVEVPVEMSYALLDKKFGIDIIGGVSTLFLSQNNVSVVSTQGYSTNVGKAQNLNNIHFSTNVGVGFKYRFFKSFEANFEPMFKYQVNTFSRDAGNFKPYFIGLYSGISFSF